MDPIKVTLSISLAETALIGITPRSVPPSGGGIYLVVWKVVHGRDVALSRLAREARLAKYHSEISKQGLVLLDLLSNPQGAKESRTG